jgi:gas vesicle protein
MNSVKETQDMDSDNRFSYFFLGLGLGTAIGLLFAPKSGSETRKYIRSKTQEGTDYLRSQGQGLMDSATEAIERTKTTIQNQVTNVSDAIDAGKQAFGDAVKSVPSKTPPV